MDQRVRVMAQVILDEALHEVVAVVAAWLVFRLSQRIVPHVGLQKRSAAGSGKAPA